MARKANNKKCGGKEEENLSLNLINKHGTIKSIRNSTSQEIVRVFNILPMFYEFLFADFFFDY
jgi:hypothetical protein